MERRQLEYFVAVAEHGGFGRASAALNVTQSAISQAIGQLERELRTKLFLRTGRHANLTAAGHAALTPARQALRDLGTIRAVVADVMGLAGGRLDIATFPPLAEWPVGAVVGAFRKKHPAVTIHIKGPTWARIPEVAEMVRDGRCELGFTDDSELAHGLIAHPLAHQDYVGVLPPETPIADNGVISLEDVVAHGLIVGPWWETSPPYLELRANYPDLMQNAIAVRIEYREAYVPLVVSGAGAAILPRFVGELASAAGATVAELARPIWLKTLLVQRPGDMAPAAREFRDVTLQLYGGVEAPADTPASQSLPT
ncbi:MULTISPECIES: LysR family transcriptional regulator [unclassified Shinella]|uniref:LysR family transcriptional regulator n=1 Tax=unclassified Shinella TaxID=2643062 RepID=UPI00225CF2EF|nr:MULTISPECIES: LysR family transcriptional regulator [unclassified Shinella]CAI0335837.1 LysR family transcriptional regulator [Rhizobiaceae bacterium]CAK7262411.1 LysR family transcriptional regulator [Shinella sp. WSC3-e]MDC7260396.1 LysR family transcriptional regulator [Shinella sp. YE25]MDC7267248.1 LysR family transcriptional regulator [Shinella sp. HY16]MDC7274133.1 LysR family transcriptional regulator [Shinella sp. YZ44]